MRTHKIYTPLKSLSLGCPLMAPLNATSATFCHIVLKVPKYGSYHTMRSKRGRKAKVAF